MASAWVWQGAANEAPTHCVFHYRNAPPVSLPPPQCYSHVSDDNTYNFPTSYGYTSLVPQYPAYCTQCVRVTFVREPGMHGEQPQAGESCTYHRPAGPPGPGPAAGPGPEPGIKSASGSAPDLSPDPDTLRIAAPTLILLASSDAALKLRASYTVKECNNELDKSFGTQAKRICRVRSRARHSQQAPAEQATRRVSTLRGIAGQRRSREYGVQDRWIVLPCPRRMTKRVGGSKTPYSYQRRRKTLIQRHLLQIPGDRHICKNVNIKTRHYHYAILATDYEQDVMTYLLEVEKRYLLTHNYLAEHPSVSQRTRAILVDWLIQVQSYLGVSRETLYQAVGMVDRVLKECCIPVHRVQLLAVTCLLIASKLEEQQPVETAELLHLTLNSYTHKELLSLERRVLQVLNFKLIYADPTVFLGYFMYLTCNTRDQTVNDCCGFLIEVVMVESWPLETRPSLLAAAALHGALMVVYGTLAASAVPLLMPKYFNLKEEEIVATSLRLLEALANRFHLPFQGAESKYASESRHHALARHPRLQPLHLFSVLDKVRANLTYLRGENTVLRSTQHRCPGDPPWGPPEPAPSPSTTPTHSSGAAAAKENQLMADCEADGGLLVPRMEGCR